MSDQFDQQSRRRFLSAGTVTATALSFGAIGSVTAQENRTENGDDSGDERFREAISTDETYFSGAVFRVVSPPLRDAPVVDDPEVLENYDTRVIEYFNTNDEGYLFVPQDAAIEEGEQFVFDDRLSSPTEDDLAAENLVQVQYRPLTEADLPFEFEQGEDFEILDESGGEGALRPDDFFSRAVFEITSGPQGWLPEDAEQSGLFTDYDTLHANYLGMDNRFLLFAQEGAQTETGQLYVMRDEFELFDPAGNLVAIEFDPVDEESLTFDDEFLR